MRATSSDRRRGERVVDPWGGQWLVRSWSVAVLPVAALPVPVPPVPVTPPDAGAPALLLAAPPAAPAPAAGAATAPRPAASWVLGRSARWHGPDAAGADDDPAREALPLLRAVALAPPLLMLPRLLVTVAARLVEVHRHSPARRRAPWVVELTDGRRTVTWAVRGPRVAARGAAAVASAVRCGTPPAPAGAELVEVRDDRTPGLGPLPAP